MLGFGIIATVSLIPEAKGFGLVARGLAVAELDVIGPAPLLVLCLGPFCVEQLN